MGLPGGGGGAVAVTLGDLIEAVERRRKRLTLYGTDEEAELLAQLATRNVDVEHRSLPEDGPPGFVVVRDREGFVGSIGVAELRELLEPPIARPWDLDLVGEGYRAVFELLDDTVFASLDRRQLLAAAREVEDRAWRVGTGTLRVGFQALSAMRAQVPVYARLGASTDLDVHVYGGQDWAPPSIPNATVHAESGGEIGSFWFLVFDGGGERTNACALIAEERTADRYYGFWTYDVGLVDRALAHLRETYG